ncbi:imidazole glycerol phosphate synthase subunit HisH [Solitalea lacus]|uniref:imidazole glycerol phosphate synthase subunit HisH n=1 Tax=Solitalea lacus TaxID=2911172 RepID=UPI001EDA17B5|nr:imidazole glycerol phosphate synthase subunit HisH [Solitalea lacus]UKJ05759.1 imidazole glycerol phosphate synthase subunit HisH [Solitalea lacus]
MIGVINYGAGNIFSLKSALNRLNIKHKIINKVSDFDGCERYIIPGVGHATPAMKQLTATGLVPLIKQTSKPVLGICLGMQLLSSFSEEGNTDLLDLIPIKTLRFTAEDLKIPHMGWNKVHALNNNTLFKGIEPDSYFYFVHSYYLEHTEQYSLATTNYGLTYASSIQKNNYFGVQFHPEKSGKTGEQLLKNFSEL